MFDSDRVVIIFGDIFSIKILLLRSEKTKGGNLLFYNDLVLILKMSQFLFFLRIILAVNFPAAFTVSFPKTITACL